MISHFFIDRPIFASVLSIVITLTGGIAVFYLPIAQYPQITPPSVQVTISYPGASAQVVADTVAAPIEQQVNGVEGMLYMSSQMGNDGSYTLTVTFDLGTDLNTALVMVQNRVTLAMPQLPEAVQNQGITIKKKMPDILLFVNLVSPDGRYDDLYLSNYATIYIKDELLRLEGVSDIDIMGRRDYSIRIWLDPQKMAALRIAAQDVGHAILGQNREAAAGQIGQPPVSMNQSLQEPVDALGRLSDPEQFGDIIVKVGRSSPPQQFRGTPGGFQSLSVAVPNVTPPLQSGGATSGGLTSGRTVGGPQSGGSLGRLLKTSTTPNMSSLLGKASGGVSTIGGATSNGGGTTGGGGNTGGGASGGSASAPGGIMIPTMTGMAQNAAAINNPLGITAVGGQTTGVVTRSPTAPIVRIRDIGRVEMGALNYSQSCAFDGQPSVGLGIHQLPGTNALDVADRVRAKMEELKAYFPDGLDYKIGYDTTPFIRESVADVINTLLVAVILVGVVVLAFLQNWRAVLIPMVAVPVAIVGTFAVMAALNFSLNNISLFGLVLAIGIVVDDAIVVVENVERWLEHGLGPREATRKAMDEVTGPVIAVALVLCTVFVPCAFISGISGQFFRQFALTIAVSTAFSAFNSLTLSPALAAILLRPRESNRDLLTRLLNGTCGWFFKSFNTIFSTGTGIYAWLVGKMLRISLVVLLGYGILVALTYWVFEKAPTGFVPQQDQGRLIVNVQLPDSASQQRTEEILKQIDKITRATEGIAHTFTVAGFSFMQLANSSNFGTIFVILDPFEKRRSPHLRDTAIMAQLQQAWRKHVKGAVVNVFGAPPIPGLSVASGFKLMVEDRAGLGLTTLQQRTDALIQKLRNLPGLAGVTTQFRSNTPQYYMDIDRTKVESLGLSLDDVNQALQMYLGSLYVNSFNAFGRYWQVTVQAEGEYRDKIEKINLIEMRNKQGQMVPLSTLVNVREIGGPVFITRYNLYSAAPITGNILTGFSTGEAIATIDKLANETLPLTMKTEWTELMYMQIRAGDTAMYVFALAVICVFLALAALYESWSLPLAVILVVPLCLLCSVAGVLYTHMAVNIFVQIGLVVLVGLACKNSILIVEFAKQLRREGRARFEATQEASRLRLRPILMTSFAFILGVFPLVIAIGAGAEMRRSLGTAVFSGMIGVTLFGIFLTPVFFYVIQGIGEWRFFKATGTQRIGSCLFGIVAGAALGFMLKRIGVLHIHWAILLGGCVGLLVAIIVMGIHRRVKSKNRSQNGGQDT